MAEKDDGLLGSIASLPRLENYTNKDRYHDFRKVFGGSVEGQRVLRYILERGGIFQEPPLLSPVDPYIVMAQKGKRHMALEIFACYNNEPIIPPTTQARKPKLSEDSK